MAKDTKKPDEAPSDPMPVEPGATLIVYFCGSCRVTYFTSHNLPEICPGCEAEIAEVIPATVEVAAVSKKAKVEVVLS